MKVLSPQAIKNSTQKEVEKDIVRIDSTKRALDEVTNELQDTEARFDIALANQKQRWAREEQEHNERAEELIKHIKKLEQERDQLLIPIDIVREKVDNDYRESQKVLSEAEAIKSKNEDITRLLEEKMDSLSLREEDIHTQKMSLESRELGLSKQVEMSKKMSLELELKWKEYMDVYERFKIASNDLKEERDRLSIERKEHLERVDSYNKDIEKFNQDKQWLADRTNTLEENYARIRQEKIEIAGLYKKADEYVDSLKDQRDSLTKEILSLKDEETKLLVNIMGVQDKIKKNHKAFMEFIGHLEENNINKNGLT